MLGSFGDASAVEVSPRRLGDEALVETTCWSVGDAVFHGACLTRPLLVVSSGAVAPSRHLPGRAGVVQGCWDRSGVLGPFGGAGAVEVSPLRAAGAHRSRRRVGLWGGAVFYKACLALGAGLPRLLQVMSSGTEWSRDPSTGPLDPFGDAGSVEMSPLRLSAVEPPVNMTWGSEEGALFYGTCLLRPPPGHVERSAGSESKGRVERGSAACGTSTPGVRAIAPKVCGV